MLAIFEVLDKIAPSKPFSLLKHKQRGFSLLEMLVVLAIVGVLASMVAARYQSFVVQREVDTVAHELVQSLESARITAQSYASEVKICPVKASDLNMPLPVCDSTLSSSDPWQAWVVLKVNNNVPTQAIIRSNVVPESVLLKGNGNKGRIFNAMGQSDFSGFTLTVNAKKVTNVKSIEIVLAPTGRVKYENI